MEYLWSRLHVIDTAEILKDLQTRLGSTSDISETFQNTGVVDIPNAFKWWFDKGNDGDGDGQSLAELALREIELYNYHTSEAHRDPYGWIWVQQHSMFQQLLWSDPLVYILNVCLRPDHNWRLMAYPEPAFRVTNATTPSPLKFPDEPEDLIYSGDNITHVRGIMGLNVESPDLCDVVVLGMQSVLKTWWGSYTKDKPSHLLNANSFAERDFEGFANLSVKPMALERGTFRVMDPRVPFGTCGKGSRALLFPTLVGIQEDLENMIPSGLGKLSDHQAMLKTLRTSSVALRDMHQKPPHDYYYAFPAAFQTSSLGSLGQAITGQKSWSAVDVLADCSAYLGADREQAWERILGWRDMVATNIRLAFGQMEALELWHFDHKSFAMMLQQPENTVAESDEDMVSTSPSASGGETEDSEDEQNEDEDASEGEETGDEYVEETEDEYEDETESISTAGLIVGRKRRAAQSDINDARSGKRTRLE